MQCYCNKPLAFESCCEPLILGKQMANSPEELMRSRFSAYVIQNYDYILATYAPVQRIKLSLNELIDSAASTKWLRLFVHNSEQKNTSGKVEFSAYYQLDGQVYLMHETSDFIFENKQWYYTTGLIHKDSGAYVQQRNDLCLCASGKKFKKCCGA